MNLTVSITDQRTKTPNYSYSTNAEVEDYERVSITDATGTKRVVADILRSIADDIDPAVKSPNGAKPGIEFLS